MILAMIVKDESMVISRCLNSAIPHIDSWIIMDTGSVDDTVEIIEDVLAGIPGRVIREEWVSFGHNRNLLLEHLSDEEYDFALLLDADMTIIGNSVSELYDVGLDVMSLESFDGGVSYWVPRIIRKGVECSYLGETHEYLKHSGSGGRYDGLKIHHHADGGNRKDKFERDREILLRSVIKDPSDSRSWFYLANTYRDLGEKFLAIDAYTTRIELGGWPEEVYYSMWQRAKLEESIEGLIAAWEYRPQRMESLHDALSILNSKGMHRTVTRLSPKSGFRVSEDALFVEPWRYGFGIETELAVARYHLGQKSEAKVIFKHILSRYREPWQESLTKRNLSFFD
jgi:glycosyltransferase involved in cell wall biosynthesis